MSDVVRAPYGSRMPDDEPTPQRWQLILDGHSHRVEARGAVMRRLAWYVDDQLVAERKSSSEKVELTAEDHPELGVVGVRFSELGRPRRATLFERDPSDPMAASARAFIGSGGLDLEPEPGSPAARYEDRLRAYPRRYALLAVAGGVAKVVAPLLLIALLARLTLSIPLPDWDLDIPWPDIHLPSIPWPDIALPSIPWPDWSLPGWLVWVLDNVHFVWPVILAVVLARGEISRRRKQDELRAARVRERESDPS
jgi:hypothetical protein